MTFLICNLCNGRTIVQKAMVKKFLGLLLIMAEMSRRNQI